MYTYIDYVMTLQAGGSSSGSSSPTNTGTAGLPGSTSTVSGINAVAQTVGKLYFGSATDNPELTDTAYTAILDDNQQFGQLTPANSMKWVSSFHYAMSRVTHWWTPISRIQDATEPEQGVFTFEQGDQIADLAKANGQLLRGLCGIH